MDEDVRLAGLERLLHDEHVREEVLPCDLHTGPLQLVRLSKVKGSCDLHGCVGVKSGSRISPT